MSPRHKNTGAGKGDERGTRERIIDAATALLSEGGYAAASVRDIAERVGLSPGALYRHFPSKGALFVEVIRAGAKRDLAALRKVRSEQDGPIHRLEAAIAAHAYRALRDPRRAWALLHEPVDPLVDEERLTHHRRYARSVEWLLRQAISAGEIPAQDVELSAAAIVGALAEALVGPLSRTQESKTEPSVIVSNIVRFCRQAVGARDVARTRQRRVSRKETSQ